MKILFKYPSRGRPERFFEGLASIYNNLLDKNNFHVLITADEDDLLMNNDDVKGRLKIFQNCDIIYGISKSKIDAVNRDMDIEGVWSNWDIVIVMSDDMRFTFYGFDQIIRQHMSSDLDLLLHIPDQDAKQYLATMYIAGRAFVKRIGHIYNPCFKSLWCDNLIMEIAQKLGKYLYVDCLGIISHLCPAYGHLERDEMFDRQQADWGHDQALYEEIKSRNYDIHLYL